MKAFKFNNKLGYTFLEIILVISLIATLLTIVLPNTGMVDKVREKDELNRLKRDILSIRTNAIVENCIYTLTLDIEKNNYKIHRLCPGNTNEAIKVVELKNGLKFQKNSSVNSIYFYTTGAPSSGMTIYLTNRKNKKIEVTIAPATGSVNVKTDE